MKRRAFTIIELLVVVSIIALLVGILLPAIGKAREQALLTRSIGNLKEIGNAHAIYSAEWNDRQITWINDGISQYGGTMTAAFGGYEAEYGQDHPPMDLGWDDQNAFWYYVPSIVSTPMHFSGQWEGWGAFRCHNCLAFNQYMNGRHYDEIWFAPKDRIVSAAVERCFANPGDFCWPEFPTQTVLDCSYSLSPAAMFNPAVMGAGSQDHAWRDPWELDAGLRSPSASAATFPTLKSRVTEHHWLNGDVRNECNGNFAGGPYNDCQPYFFNQSWRSSPATLFYDGHIEQLGVREAVEAHNRALQQTGSGLWNQTTPWGTDGYYHPEAYDFQQFIGSFHVLTTDGIKGRDKDAR